MRSVFQALAELEARNGAGALCMVVRSKGSTPRHTGSKMLVYPDGSIVGTVGGGELENRVIAEAKQAILDGQSRLLEYDLSDPARGDPGVCGGQVEVFVEPVLPKPTLIVIGAGHVGRAVVHLAKWLGFRVVVNDDRAEFCTPEATPEADEYILATMAELPQRLEITPWTYLVLTTRGVNVDVQGLPALLDTPAAYIGLIGSQRRWETAKKRLREQGVPDEKLDRVRSPIGLELNAETPEEIALSILAEIVMLRQGGDGKVMSAAHATTAARGKKALHSKSD
ncbi:MAG: XdhC family protein [Anaerolineales bacterium]|jgi:xanthine dehydrogenase accessory factor|nr:XdhC family protein [Anaerolineales bacterium]